MSSRAGRPPRFPAALDRLPAPGGAGAAPAGGRALLRPQRLVHEAVRDAARADAPRGLGMDSAQVRQKMVLRLREGGVRNEALLESLGQVPRHQFVDTALATQAYEDTSLPIGHGQTISKPSVVARMIDLLFEGATARRQGHLGSTLEVGTGCGYQTALLGRLARRVVSIERLKPLHDKARAQLAQDRQGQIRLLHGDGMLGHAPSAPFDSIICAAGGDVVPQPWLDQLALGGRLVAPIHRPGRRGQVLLVVDRHDNGYVHAEHEAVHFVPLKSGVF